MNFNLLIGFVFLNLFLFPKKSSAGRMSEDFKSTHIASPNDKNLMVLNGFSTDDFSKLTLESFRTDPLVFVEVSKVLAQNGFPEYVQELYLSFLKYFYEASRRDLFSNLNLHTNTDRVIEGHIRTFIFFLQKNIYLNLNEDQIAKLRKNLLKVFNPKINKKASANQCEDFLNN